ncbi:hypothetical protein C4546_01270 [Candidatus Parcubacteria bacterium]|jgi:uncharacterized membrane protein|nr:MAG: hypothetical protein C4546_01270 [Candidatus Parcubacteria bacterium]
MLTKKGYMLVGLFALAGVALSGYLSYVNLFKKGCTDTFITCSGSTGPVEILGVPNCVYGFFMFLAVLILALFGLKMTEKKGLHTSVLVLGVIGTLFALGLSIYEIFWLKPDTLPACVYGLFFYLGILITAWVSSRAKTEPEQRPIQ